MKEKREEGGFLVLEILIAGLVLTASIAVTMYMFRLGYGYLDQTRKSNEISSMLIQAAGFIKTLDLDRQSGTEEIDNNVKLTWKAKLLSKSRPSYGQAESQVQSPHELWIYQVNFTLQYKEALKDYQTNVFKYKPLYAEQSKVF